MNCPQCGAPLRKGAVFCNNCGQKKKFTLIPVQGKMRAVIIAGIIVIIGIIVILLFWGVILSLMERSMPTEVASLFMRSII